MSCVNMVPTACTCESKEFMIAAKTPAASSPASTPGACWSIICTRTEFAAAAPRFGKSARASTPRITLGTQTIAMHTG